MVNGKAKGASFEREICRRLSLWVSHGISEDCYWRSAMSGGRSTVAHAKGKRLAAQAGDISCINPLGQALADKFFIECKSYKDLQFTGLITGKGHLHEFWIETKKQSVRYSKLPLMVVKQNRYPIVICLCRKGLDVLNLRLKCVLTAPRANLYAVLLDDFEKLALRPANGNDQHAATGGG